MMEFFFKQFTKGFPVAMYSLKEEYIQQFKLINGCDCFTWKVISHTNVDCNLIFFFTKYIGKRTIIQ